MFNDDYYDRKDDFYASYDKRQEPIDNEHLLDDYNYTYKKRQETSERATQALRAKDNDLARVLLDLPHNKNSPVSAMNFEKSGYDNFNSQKYEAALGDFTRAIELNPNDDNHFHSRAMVYHRLKKYEAALEDYTRAIELNPNDNKHFHNRGGIHFDLKKYEEAIEDYSRAIKLGSPDKKYSSFLFSLTERGIAYYRLKKYEAALEDFTQAIKLDPNEPRLLRWRDHAQDRLKEIRPFGESIFPKSKIDQFEGIFRNSQHLEHTTSDDNQKT